MKLHDKLKKKIRKLVFVEFVIILIFFAVISLINLHVTKQASETVSLNNKKDMEEDAVNLARESALFLNSLEDEIDKAMYNAASVLRTATLVEEMNIDQMREISEKTGMSDMYLFDTNGDTTLSTVKEAAGFNLFSVWDGYRDLVTGKAENLPSNIKIMVETGDIYKFTAIPTYDSEGNINGISQSALNASDVEERVKSILNEKGMINAIYLFQEDGLTLLSVTKQDKDVLSKKGDTFNDDTIKSVYQGSEAKLVDKDNASLYCYFPVQRYGSNAYVLLMDIDKGYYLENSEFVDNIMKRTHRQLIASLIFVSVLSVVSIILVVKFLFGYVKKDIIDPIDRMSNIANAVAAGKIEFESENYEDDEIGRLYKAFVSVVNSIKHQMKTLSMVSDGDFSVSIKERSEHDSLYRTINEMVRLLNASFIKIKEATAKIDSSSKQVSESSQTLAQGAGVQAGSIEELSASLSYISNQVNINAENAKIANQLANVSEKVTQDTLADMQEMSDSMNEISESSDNISRVIKVIDDIAFQTNILALNAAVEAARAGEAGKGFAVVADEVRNLAAKSSEASKETAGLIETSIIAVKRGENIAQKTRQAFEDLAGKVEEMAKTVEKITAATDEQASSIHQISNGVEQISSVVQSNSATSEESAAVSVELSEQANILKDLVSQFKLLS